MRLVNVKAFVGLLLLILVIAMALFVPAGTLHYWQAWIFLITFFITVLLITLYLVKKDQKLLERRVNAGPVAEKQRSQKIIQSIAQLAFLLMFIIPSLDFRYHWSYVPVSICLIGEIIVVVGLFIVFLVFKQNSYTAAIINTEKNQKVITTGLYHYVRHPMYSGAMVMLLGVPLALGSWWGLSTLIPMYSVIIIRLLDEERFLMKNLEGYKQYCHTTHFHLVPYIW